MKDKVIKILTDIRPEFDFSIQVNFIEEGMLDSFDVVSLVTALDTEFGISIDGMDIRAENFSSVENIIYLLHKNGVIK
jgi:acyl carrier protein